MFFIHAFLSVSLTVFDLFGPQGEYSRKTYKRGGYEGEISGLVMRFWRRVVGFFFFISFHQLQF